jgi:hypothetical protein
MRGLLVGMALLFAIPCFAGEKEELELKKMVLTERIQKLEAYKQLMDQQIQISQKEAADITTKLKSFEPKKEKPAEKK